MSLFRRIAELRAIKGGITNPRDPAYWLVKMFGGGPATSGVEVTEDKALSWTALSAGLRISAETLGSLSWGLFERLQPRGRKERTEDPRHFLLHNEPNPEMTSMEYFETAQAHALWWGGSPSQVVRDGAGRILEVWPLSPDRTLFERVNGALCLRVTLPRDEQGGVGGSVVLPPDEYLWVRGFSTGGLFGARLAQWHKEAIGLGLVTELYSAAFFGRGASAGGILSHPSRISKEAQARLREAIDHQVGGIDRAHRTLILEEAMEWKQTTVDPEKSQLLGLRKFQVSEASRILRIPAHMLGDLERATFSNIEHQAIEFVQHHVRPWAVRWEQRLNRSLFTRAEKQKLYVKADLNALLRGDMKSRFEAYQIGIQQGFLSRNEAREFEDMNPGPAELDTYLEPQNMAPAGQAKKGGDNGSDPGTEALAPAA